MRDHVHIQLSTQASRRTMVPLLAGWILPFSPPL